MLRSVDPTGELARALADAGGAGAPREWSARLRDLLREELVRGARELGEARTGKDAPIALGVAASDAAVVAVLPLPPELRADVGAVGERGQLLAAVAVERLVEAAEPGPAEGPSDLVLALGSHDSFLALSYPAADPDWSADYAREALDDAVGTIDRLRAAAHLLPAHVLAVEDLRPPIGATHPLRVAEAVTRLGGSPLDEESLESLEPELLRVLAPSGTAPRAHDDPDSRRRVMRRILQRLDGMGKWGGYHTAFDHLARGFAGNERALAYEVGEELLAAGLLEQKPSVGQRHVYLSTRRAGDIRRLIDEGVLPPGL
jgi:hypothetical protein